MFVVKALLGAVKSGIVSFDAAFLPDIVLPNGSTVGDSVVPVVGEMYATSQSSHDWYGGNVESSPLVAARPAPPGRRTSMSSLTRPLAFALAAASLAAAPLASAATAAPAATATASVTRATTAVTNVRSAASTTSSIVGKLSANTKITGTLTNGWVKISTPTTFAGRYVSNNVLTNAPTTTTPSPAPTTGMTGWAGYTRTQLLNSSGTVVGYLPANTKITGTLSGASFVLNGAYAGKRVSKYDVMWTNPAFALTGSTTAASPKAPTGRTVTRYLIKGLDCSPALRSAPSTHSTLMKRLTPGSSFTGTYVNASWFKVTSGVDAGRYISAALLHTTSTMSAVNGTIPSTDLCLVPSTFNTNWSPSTPRTLQCGALAGLKEMNAAYRARFGVDLQLDEGYRDRHTQDMYYRVYGYPSAAIPGTSNHGYGRAIDLLGKRSALLMGVLNPYRFGTPQDAWLSANGKNYGWDRPEAFDQNGSNPEFWHYNWIG